MGLKYAGLVLLLDALKGSLCIVIARLLESHLGLSPWWTAGTGIAVFMRPQLAGAFKISRR